MLRPRRRRSLIVATLLCAALLLWAGRAAQTQTSTPPAKTKPHPIDAFYDACVEKDGSTAGMLRCTEKTNALWDKQMNKDYAALLKSANPKTRLKMRDSQRAWLVYRDKEQAMQNEFYHRDGTMWGPIRANIGMRLVKERALQLADYLSDNDPH